MEALLSLIIGVLTGCGVYLILRARTFPVVLGLTFLSYGVNLFLFSTGRLVIGRPRSSPRERRAMRIPSPRPWCSPPS
jgi:multicomponent K+:H+ antiporter subunit C